MKKLLIISAAATLVSSGAFAFTFGNNSASVLSTANQGVTAGTSPSNTTINQTNNANLNQTGNASAVGGNGGNARGGNANATANNGGNSADANGGRANGGDVYAGVSYPVGERGVEVFTPATNGTITPNNKIGNTYNLNVYTTQSPDVVERSFNLMKAFAGA